MTEASAPSLGIWAKVMAACVVSGREEHALSRLASLSNSGSTPKDKEALPCGKRAAAAP
jgi:hypothetical protein